MEVEIVIDEVRGKNLVGGFVRTVLDFGLFN